MGRPVAIVTGANRGIGLAVVRYLGKHFHGDVLLTCRRTPDGEKVMRRLSDEGLKGKVKFHELDITIADSIWMLHQFIAENYGGVDILINCASMNFEKDNTMPIFLKANSCFDVDVFGTLNVCKIFSKLLRPHARVVVMTNGYIGQWSCLRGDAADRFKTDDMSLYDLETLAREYLKAVRYGTHSKYGWPDSPSQVAKLFRSALAEVFARAFTDDRRHNILVNACCPGWTASGGSKEYMDDKGLCQGMSLQSPDETAVDVAWVGLIAPGTSSPCGQVVRHRKVVTVK